MSDNAFGHYEQNIGVLSSSIIEKITNWLGDVDHSLIEYAIDEACENNARTWKYIEAILNDHFKAGRRTRCAAESHSRNRNKSIACGGAAKKSKFDNFSASRGGSYEDIEKRAFEEMLAGAE